MKKFILVFASLLISTFSFAKKVKFSVDMDTCLIPSTGIHVMGDFQTLLGCPVDFDPACTPLLQEASTTIYSTIVDIPAFHKYEYIFVKGDQSYEVESIPYQSVVGYNFDQNRWIYIDSLADDTTDIGAVIFRQNAPRYFTLIRFKVDMHEEASISPNGVHVAGNFQGWDPSKINMYSFVPGIYEIISFLPGGTYEYEYYNGNTPGTDEIIPGPCSVNSHREVVLNVDTIMHDSLTGFPVCFGSCIACVTAGIEENNSASSVSLFPNPAKNQITIRNPQHAIRRIEIVNVLGSVVYQSNILNPRSLIPIDLTSLRQGLYFVKAKDYQNKTLAVSKLILE